MSQIKKYAVVGFLCIAFNVANAQDDNFDTGEADIDAALERIEREIKEKAAAEISETAIEVVGDKTLKDLAKAPLRMLRRVNAPGLFFETLFAPSSTAKFDTTVDLSLERMETTIVDPDYIDELMDQANIDAATLVDDLGYDLYAPGALAKFEADLRRRILEVLVRNGDLPKGMSHILAEIHNLERRSADQARQARASRDDLMSESHASNEIPSNFDLREGECTVSQPELFNFFLVKNEGEIDAANSAILDVSNHPSTEIISAQPFIYRLRDIDLCTALDNSITHRSFEIGSAEESSDGIWRDYLEGCMPGLARILSNPPPTNVELVRMCVCQEEAAMRYGDQKTYDLLARGDYESVDDDHRWGVIQAYDEVCDEDHNPKLPILSERIDAFLESEIR